MKNILLFLILATNIIAQTLGPELILTNPDFNGGDITGWSNPAAFDTWAYKATGLLSVIEDGNAESYGGSTDEIVVKINRAYLFKYKYTTNAGTQTSALAVSIAQAIGSGNHFGGGANQIMAGVGAHTDSYTWIADESNTGVVYMYNPLAKVIDVDFDYFSLKTYKTYYISNDGNDTNLGTTSGAPRKTLENVSFFQYDGDSLLFRAGDEFSGTLTISADVTVAGSGATIEAIECGDNAVTLTGLDFTITTLTGTNITDNRTYTATEQPGLNKNNLNTLNSLSGD